MGFTVPDDDGTLLHMALALVDSWVDDADDVDVTVRGDTDLLPSFPSFEEEEVDEMLEIPSLIMTSPTASAANSCKRFEYSYFALNSDFSGSDEHVTTSEDDGGADASDESLATRTHDDANERTIATSPPTPQSPSPQSQPPVKKRSSKWTKSAAEAVKRNRAKKQAEAVALRAQLQELETMLRTLQQQQRERLETACALQVQVQRKRRKDGSYELQAAKRVAEAALAGHVRWRVAAATQARERHEALALNAQLRDAIGHHASLIKGLQTMLMTASKQPRYGLDLLRDEQRNALFSDMALHQDTSLLVELRMRVLQMNAQVDSVFTHHFWRQFGDTVLSLAHVKLDAEVGPLFELLANAPVPCRAHVAGDLLWKRALALRGVINTPKYVMKRQLLSSSSFEKIYTLRLDGGPAGPVELKGTCYFQQFYEGERYALLWATKVRSQYGETFVEKAWVVAFPGPRDDDVSTDDAVAATTDGPNRSFFRVLYQISTEGGVDLEADAQAPLQKAQRLFVLKELSARTHMFQEYVQNMLLDEFSGYQMRKPLDDSPCIRYGGDGFVLKSFTSAVKA